MPVPNVIREAKGKWAGFSRLYLPFLPEGEQIIESGSQLQIDLSLDDATADVRYTWSYEGEQVGTAIIAARKGVEDSGECTMGWVDSWHQNTEVMLLKEHRREPNEIEFAGEYGREQPRWGWRIGFRLEGEKLVMHMTNVDPAGPEEWAVEAIYERA